MIRSIEELSLNAWPALQTMVWDGWVLRFADGYTRRANSVNPLYPGDTDLSSKIEACARIYRGQGLDVVFKITPAVQPAHLDDALAARGYVINAQTSVQILTLNGQKLSATDVTLTESLTDDWLSAFWEMSHTQPQHHAIHRQMLGHILPATCFAYLRQQNQIIACGLGVCQQQFVGLYDIVTHPNFRGQGYGTQIVQSILAWGQAQGAPTAYLQVMLNNPPALRLYARLGFNELYQYWYRSK
jgi:ribosomal protein S18 acetylase RimI-like enzyme